MKRSSIMNKCEGQQGNIVSLFVNSIKYHLQHDKLSKSYMEFITSISSFIIHNDKDLLSLLVNISNVDCELLEKIAIGTRNLLDNFNYNDNLTWEHLLLIKSATRGVLNHVLDNIKIFLHSPIDAIVVTYMIQSSSIDYSEYYVKIKLSGLFSKLRDTVCTPEPTPCGLSRRPCCQFCSGMGNCLHSSISKLLLLCFQD